RRSGAIARSLRDGGVAVGDVVAIWAHRSAPLVAAILGVLRAGAALAILDPAYPAARLAERVRSARPRGLVEVGAAGPVPAALDAALPPDAVRVAAEAAAPAAASPADDATAPTVRGDDLAYVAFTSGSTGRPKAIVGTHRPLGHFLAWQRATFGLDRDDRFSLLAGLSH